MIYRLIPVVAAFVLYFPILKLLLWVSEDETRRDKFEIFCLTLLAVAYDLLLVVGTYLIIYWVITGGI